MQNVRQETQVTQRNKPKRTSAATPKRDVKRGTWYIVFDAPRDPTTNKRNQIKLSGFATKRRARDAMVAKLSEIANGSYVHTTKDTLGAYLIDQWLPTRRNQVTESTFEWYGRLIRVHILSDHLASIRLQDLTALDLDRYYAQKLADGRRDGTPGGLSVSSVIKLHALINGALKDARRYKLVATNVAEDAKPPSRKSAPGASIKIWSPEQLAQFLDYIYAINDPLKAAYWLAAHTGMRRGELLGLAWSDIDFHTSVVTIRSQLLSINGRAVLTNDTKTHRKRAIPIDATTLQQLREHRVRQLEYKLAIGAGYRDTGRVFTRVDGSYLDPQGFTEMFRRRTKSAGVPIIRLHDLRHTHISLLVANGRIVAASARAGHSSVGFTMATYAHLQPSEHADAANEFAGIVEAARSKRPA